MSTEKTVARENLRLLLEDFQKIATGGDLDDQPEAAARTWVERFLAVFGWDTADPRQVVQEYRIVGREARRLAREGSSHRRPDYALVVDGDRQVYLDAKRFDVCVEEDENAAYQVRSYGWSAGFRLSYICNLKEIAIYDCRVKPEPRDMSPVARLHYLHHGEYLDRFDLLWEYFSRDAVSGGSLARLHPDDERPRGSQLLDEDFEEKLSVWRREIAQSIRRHAGVRDAALLSAASQRILDRIIFLRFCEEIGIEELGSLLSMAQSEDGFWPLFLEQHERRYCRVYDGILFPHSSEDDPTGVDRNLRDWWLKGRIFRDIVQSLYFPNPYRFDVIPVELLGGIYEKYLGRKLRVVGKGVEDEFKPEYQRTQGAIYTPPWVVRRIVQKVLAPLVENKDPDEVLRLRILDPACGSAGFLLGAYDYIEQELLDWFHAHPRDRRRGDFVVDSPDGPRLSTRAVRAVVEGCLHGVDIDPEAVEVARMSLALRFLDRTVWGESGTPSDLLAGIGRNIRHGNSLVGVDILGLGLGADRVIREVMPFDWRNPHTGFGDVMQAGGFDAVIGNPPYIEVKRYREWQPAMYDYLKGGNKYETVGQGKADISIAFVERGVKLLKPGGRLGFIIQNRFFKTDYGADVRGWLRRSHLLEEIEDFRDLQVFPGRTTYTAILILQPGRRKLRYSTFRTLSSAQAGRPDIEVRLPHGDLDDDVWSFDQPDLLDLHRALTTRHGAIGSHAEIRVSVGLQTLYGKVYQLRPVAVRKLTVMGVNGLGEEATLERGAMRPLCQNDRFYPFRVNNADAWVIFPYEVDGEAAQEIPWPEFRRRFPRTADYLQERKKKIRDAVETLEGPSRWHLYTRPQNLASQALPKVLIPSTIEDTLATVDGAGDVYHDNVRVNSLSFTSPTDLMAAAAVINSTVFNALALLKAGLSDAGWRQFNRQFVDLVPFPLEALGVGAAAGKLSDLGRQIQGLQDELLQAKGEGGRQGVRAALDAAWRQLDEEVESLYGLSGSEREVVARYPRRIDRVDLVLRQAARAAADAE